MDRDEEFEAASSGADDDMRPYRYNPLSATPASIRLLSLFPGRDFEDIRIELYEVPFDINAEERDYEALSWCWGKSTTRQAIKVTQDREDFQILISPELHAAMKGLRRRNRTRILWIDAICINQRDISERNHQVALMARIYERASKVSVWLGEADSSSKVAMNFIKKEVMQFQNFDELCDREEMSVKWFSMLQLMQRPWFTRRWVIQEIVLAKQADMYCGFDMIPWTDFAVAVELFVEVGKASSRVSEFMRKDPRFYHLPGWFEYVSSLGASLLVDATRKLVREYGAAPAMGGRRRLFTLESLVSTLSIFQASVPHDSIYSLLSIASDVRPVAKLAPPTPSKAPSVKILEAVDTLIGTRNLLLEKPYLVDYDLSYTEVCQQFITFSIQRQSDRTTALDVICRPFAQGNRNRPFEGDPNGSELRNPELPSWVPQLCDAPYANYSRPGSDIMIMGRKNANILVGDSSAQRNYNASMNKEPVFGFKKGHNYSSMLVKGFILDSIEFVAPASQGGHIPVEWLEMSGWNFEDEPPDNLWRLLVADRDMDGSNCPFFYRKACYEMIRKGGIARGSISTSDLMNNERSSIIAQFCKRVQAVIWNRALVKTRASGRLGLVRKRVVPGDLVCILYGCSVPVILRKHLKPAAQREKEQGEWKRVAKAAWSGMRNAFERKRKYQSVAGSDDDGDGDSPPSIRRKISSHLANRRVSFHPPPAPPVKMEQTTLSDNTSLDLNHHVSLPQPFKPSPPSSLPANPHIAIPETTKSSQTAQQEVGGLKEVMNASDEVKQKDALDAIVPDFYYEFLGECYIHGMMDGEALTHRAENGIRISTFELR